METWRRLFIVIGGFIEALLFSGCLFGWGSLVHVLQQEEVYYHLCDEQDSFMSLPPQNLSGNEFGIVREFSGEISATETNLDPYQSSYKHVMDNSGNLYMDSTSSFAVEQNLQYFSTMSTIFEDAVNRTTLKHVVRRCLKQDEKFNLIYVVASVNYGLTAFIVGYCLDRFGLWATRILASLMTTGGFFCLAFTSKAIPWLLWPALNFISLGTIQLRQSSFQFANAYPRSRATILTAYSAGYSISTILFLLIQYAYKSGFPYQSTVLVLTGISTLTLPFTFIMPKMKIEDHQEPNQVNSEKDDKSRVNSADKDFCNEDSETEDAEMLHSTQVIKLDKSLESDEFGNNNGKTGSFSDQHKSNNLDSYQATNKLTDLTTSKNPTSLKESLFTLSALLHLHWQFINFFLVLFYSATFVPWAYKITDDPHEVTLFNEISGLCQLIAPAFIPMAGLITDALTKRASRYENRIERKAAELEAPAYAIFVATIFLIALLTCKMFLTRAAIYASMVLIAICRPLVVGCCTTYIRLRFPAEHFNRLFGIFTTLVSFFALSQYLIFGWMNLSPENTVAGHWLLMAILITSLASPGHMLLRCLSRKYAQRLLKHSLIN